jgi:MraZ protein
VLAAPGLDPRSAALKRLLVGNARDEEMDSTGRVLIAPELRDWAKLEKQVWLVGQGDHFELWSDEGWKRQQAEMLALFSSSALPAGLEDLTL